MKKLPLAVACLTLAATSSAALGGWAIVTVDDVPDYFVVGAPTTLTFQIRQHGESPLEGLTPRVEARSGWRRVTTTAVATATKGAYRAQFTFPARGDWRVVVHSGFGNSRGELLPIPVLDSAEPRPRITDAQRGRALFAAKGCVSCHMHRAVDIGDQFKIGAPDLTTRRFEPAYLARYLADPSIKPRAGNTPEMPNLRLRPQEIGALVAFLNDQRVVGQR